MHFSLLRYHLLTVILELMTKDPKEQAGVQSDVDTMRVLLSTIGDTTWRMFVPSVGLTLLGVWADGEFGTKPWLMVLGIILGFFGAFLLVKKQVVGLKSRRGVKR